MKLSFDKEKILIQGSKSKKVTSINSGSVEACHGLVLQDYCRENEMAEVGILAESLYRSFVMSSHDFQSAEAFRYFELAST